MLKWHWWRLNGFGYFWGMVAGLVGAIALLAFPHVNLWTAFPVLLLLSTAGSVVGSLLTKPEEESVLVEFYMRTRPWGWWGPIHKAALRVDPNFAANRDFRRDALNVVIGVVWQTSLVVLPIYVVIRDWDLAAVAPGGRRAHVGTIEADLVRPAAGELSIAATVCRLRRPGFGATPPY